MSSTYQQLNNSLESLKLLQMKLHLDEVSEFVSKNKTHLVYPQRRISHGGSFCYLPRTFTGITAPSARESQYAQAGGEKHQEP